LGWQGAAVAVKQAGKVKKIKIVATWNPQLWAICSRTQATPHWIVGIAIIKPIAKPLLHENPCIQNFPLLVLTFGKKRFAKRRGFIHFANEMPYALTNALGNCGAALRELERWIFIELALALFLAAWLLLLRRRRDLWLRYTAAEAAFSLRLRLPARFVNASRRWEEGRSFVYWVAGMLVVTLLILAAAGVADIYVRSLYHQLTIRTHPR
jgi:hypothetical protein